jgi:hypothetical protein
LAFKPFKGNVLQINSTLYTIPNGGIVGLANTSVYVNGVAGQNLVASTLYYVYAFNNSGTITADFSTTAHVTSTTGANAGTEIKNGDDTRTLLGMVYTQAATPGTFIDSITYRYTRSWFNPVVATLQANGGLSNIGGGTVATSTTLAVCWANESYSMRADGYINNTVTQYNGYVMCWLDGAQAGPRISATSTNTSWNTAASASTAGVLAAEGLHTFQGAGATDGGNQNTNVSIAVTLFGP